MSKALNAACLAVQRLRNRVRAGQLKRAARRPLDTPSSDVGACRRTVRLPCRYCDSATQQHQVLGAVPLTSHARLLHKDYFLAQCLECEVIHLQPEPPADDLQSLYIGSRQFADPAAADDGESARIARSYERRLHYLDLYPRPGDTVLEVGAGPAWVCRAIKRHCPAVKTVAQDISDECATSTPWVDDYRVGELDRLVPDGSIQLLSLTHVLEHVPRPREFLQRLAAYAAPLGKVYITAPYRPAMWRAEEGFDAWLRYSYLHVPAHISYFSEKWMRACASEAGFDLVRWDASLDGYQAFEAILQRKA